MTEAEPTASEYTIKPLGPDTWEAFAQLAERHNGVWGGCWCTWFHPRRLDESEQHGSGGLPAVAGPWTQAVVPALPTIGQTAA